VAEAALTGPSSLDRHFFFGFAFAFFLAAGVAGLSAEAAGLSAVPLLSASLLAVNGGTMSEPSEVLLTALVFTGALGVVGSDFAFEDESEVVVDVVDVAESDDGAGADAVSAGSVVGAFGSGLAPPHATLSTKRSDRAIVRIVGTSGAPW
jgi:hypothetical protein